MPRKAKHLTVADLEAVEVAATTGLMAARLQPVSESTIIILAQLTAIRLRSWARSEIARRAKAGAGRKVEGK